MFDDLKRMFAENRLKDEAIFAFVLAEMEGGVRRDGLWAKALAESKFEEGATKACYMKLRVQSIKDELAAQSISKVKLTSLPADSQVETKQVSFSGSVQLGTAHTTKEYVCNNCGVNGKMFVKEVGFFKRKTMICPRCGNRGNVIG